MSTKYRSKQRTKLYIIWSKQRKGEIEWTEQSRKVTELDSSIHAIQVAPRGSQTSTNPPKPTQMCKMIENAQKEALKWDFYSETLICRDSGAAHPRRDLRGPAGPLGSGPNFDAALMSHRWRHLAAHPRPAFAHPHPRRRGPAAIPTGRILNLLPAFAPPSVLLQNSSGFFQNAQKLLPSPKNTIYTKLSTKINEFERKRLINVVN